MEVAADAPGVAWDWGQSGEAGQSVGAVIERDVAAERGKEFGAQARAEARHAQNALGVAVAEKPVLDRRVDFLECGVEVITCRAWRATTSAASCSPGTIVCWVLAAATAVSATV